MPRQATATEESADMNSEQSAMITSTGSEVTRFTIITDQTSNEKLLCAGLAYLPVAALVARPGDSDETAVANLVNELTQLNVDLEVPSPERFGIQRAEWDNVLDVMAEQALASGSPSNNPIVPGAGDIRALYQRAYHS